MNSRTLRLSRPAVTCAFALAACGGGPGLVDPDAVLPSLSETLETASHVFHLSAGDSVESEWQEQYHQWATQRLGVALPGRIEYFKYSDDAQMRALTGRGCCFAEPERLAVHTVWSRDNHEVVHVYAARIGEPSNFFSEGLAVAFQTDPPAGDFEPRWSGIHLHTLAARSLAEGSVPALVDMVETEDFRRIPSQVGYPIAGSFALFLIEQHGLDRLLAFYGQGGGPTESRDHIASNFRASFGRSLEDAEAAWHARLRAWQDGD